MQLGLRPVLQSVVDSTVTSVRSRINSLLGQQSRPHFSMWRKKTEEQLPLKNEAESTPATCLPKLQPFASRRGLAIARGKAGVRTSFNVLLVDPTKKWGGQLHKNVPASAWALSGFQTYRTMPDKPHRNTSRGRGARQRPHRVATTTVKLGGVDGFCVDASILSIAVPIAQ